MKYKKIDSDRFVYILFVIFPVLEVYQFARDAAVAEAWLIAQEPYLLNQELGDTLDAVENLIKKHEAFEKSAATQEERFAALEKLTTVSVICMYWQWNRSEGYLVIISLVLHTTNVGAD